MNYQEKASPELLAWLEGKVKTLADELARYCGPIFDPDAIFGGGTYALIDTGQKRLLVTCCHVWDEFEKRHDAESKTRLAMAVNDSAISFEDPRKHLIAADRDLDLAVFEFAPETIGVPHKKTGSR
jgi:hypothetical protein